MNSKVKAGIWKNCTISVPFFGKSPSPFNFLKDFHQLALPVDSAYDPFSDA